MEKNVVVIDEQGNKIGATFPKRAKGLVKKGRARFVDENTICLACPPKEFLEDNKMNNNINESVEKIIINTIEENDISEEDIDETEVKPLTSREIFEQIKKLQEDKLKSPLNSFDKLAGTVGMIFDQEAQENEDRVKVVELLTDAFNSREETTWKILKLYEKMQEDVAKLEKLAQTRALIQGTYVGMLVGTNNSHLDDDLKVEQNQAIIDKMSYMI